MFGLIVIKLVRFKLFLSWVDEGFECCRLVLGGLFVLYVDYFVFIFLGPCECFELGGLLLGGFHRKT